jgi:hypothetical protein
MMLELLGLIIPARLRGEFRTKCLNLRVVPSFAAKKEPDCSQFFRSLRYRGGSVNPLPWTDNACA